MKRLPAETAIADYDPARAGRQWGVEKRDTDPTGRPW